MRRIINSVFILTFALGSFQSQISIAMSKKIEHKINIYKDDDLTALYDSSNGCSYLYIPDKDFIGLNKEQVNLKKILESDGIRTIDYFSNKPWSEDTWCYAERRFKEIKEYYCGFNRLYTQDVLLKLLVTAKTVIKSFLPVNDDFSPISMQNEYIKKSGINRLFTYAKLQHVIKEKKLTHVRLPSKFLFIKDNETGKYVSTKQAFQVIDDLLKIGVKPDTFFIIDVISDRYALDIFAKREIKNKGNGLSRATMTELVMLYKEAPFDIGYDNIFWESNGNGVIIDTEHKSETISEVEKLGRYSVDESI